MRTGGIPNKFEIFQDFYLETNGVEISYREALRLFAKMDAETKSEFEQYYQDETGYEIITPSGYDLDPDLGKPVQNGTKKKKKKVKQADGSIKWEIVDVPNWTMEKTLADGTVINNYVPQTVKHNINLKYTLDGYAKEKGLVLDPQWAIYSAEEIIQMADGGVNIPKEVVEIANAAIQTTLNTEITSESEESDSESEKDSFLNLIPKAQKKIKKCAITNEKIEDKIEDILPEKSRMEKSFTERMKEQKRSLEEYEAYIREWNKLQTKINNGEALSDSEARRYAQLTGMFNDKKSSNTDFSINKREIARSMNELNILSILGEQLADETIEIGESLADLTINSDYKAGKVKQTGLTGLLQSISLMAFGKDIAKATVACGNETKEYTEETQNSVNDIAQILDIGGLIAGKDEILANEEVKTEEPGSEETVQDVEKQPAQSTDSAQGEEKDPEVTAQEDFVINDKNVKELIKEARDINTDLAKQTINAVKGFKIARNNRKFAKIAGFKVTILVKRFKDEEEKRQEKIQELEKENKNADEELKELTGKTAEELDKEEQTGNETEQGDSNKKPQDKTNEVKVKVLRSKVVSNNSEIEDINTESETAKDKFANATAKESEIISQAIPEEVTALKYNNEYKEEVIPEAKERLDFTNASGETLSKIGMYRVEIGMMQIMAWQLIKGLRNVALGTISTGIGIAAQAAGDSPLPKIAEKATDKTVKEEGESIDSLSDLETKIISVTGAEATPTEENSEETEENAEDTENTENVETVQAKDTKETTVNETTEVETPDEVSTSTTQNSTKNSETTNSTKKEESPEALANNAKKQKSELSKQTDAQNDIVKESNKTAKDAGKESKKIEKDEKKDAKQLDKEAKLLEKQIKQEEQEVIKLTQESQKAVEKQEQAFARYETIAAESEQLMAEEEAKQSKQANQNNAQGLASNSFTVTNTSDGMSDNQGKLLQNSMMINELGVVFKSQDRIVIRNKARISTIRDSINNKSVKFEKKLKIKDKQLKETEKKEQEKQKQLTKTMAGIGIAENVFSITSSTGKVLITVGTPLEASGAALITSGTVEIATGTPMLSNPITAAAGAALVAAGTAQVTTGTTMETCGITLQSVGGVLKTVGLVGTTACGVTKGVINVANGNLAGGLMAIGASAVSVVTSLGGCGTAAGSALTYISEGLNIVSSTAELTNNVRAVQGKEANGTASKIATLAGVGSSLTNAASSITNMGNQNVLGKISTITSATGTALSSTSQVMSEFELGDEKTAQTLGAIGGGLQTVGSVGQMFGSNNNKKENENKKEKDINEAINNDKNIKAEDKAKIDSALEKMANDPEVQKEVIGNSEFQSQDNSQTDTTAKKNLPEAENKEVQEQPQVVTQKNESVSDTVSENKDTSKTSKKEKINNALDFATQALNTTGQVMNLLNAQNATNAQEGETKKKNAAPGKLTKRAKEIIKKNERYRQKIVKALARSQRHYA